MAEPDNAASPITLTCDRKSLVELLFAISKCYDRLSATVPVREPAIEGLLDRQLHLVFSGLRVSTHDLEQAYTETLMLGGLSTEQARRLLDAIIAGEYPDSYF